MPEWLLWLVPENYVLVWLHHISVEDTIGYVKSLSGTTRFHYVTIHVGRDQSGFWQSVPLYYVTTRQDTEYYCPR